MGMIRGAIKAGIAMKVLEIAKREASKPQNQAKAREMMRKLSQRRAQRPR